MPCARLADARPGLLGKRLDLRPTHDVVHSNAPSALRSDPACPSNRPGSDPHAARASRATAAAHHDPELPRRRLWPRGAALAQPARTNTAAGGAAGRAGACAITARGPLPAGPLSDARDGTREPHVDAPPARDHALPPSPTALPHSALSQRPRDPQTDSLCESGWGRNTSW